MSQKKLEDWISPLEASLEMSIRAGCYISPDDIKQARKRLPDGACINVSKRASVYRRGDIRSFKIVKLPSKQQPPPVEKVVAWLWEFPDTIKILEQEGFTIPNKAEALTLLEEQRANKQKNPKPKKIAL